MRNHCFAFCLTFACIIALSSCQKETNLPETKPDNLDTALLGNWKFIESHITTEVTDEISGSGYGKVKSIATSDYLTINNKGSVTIEETKILSKQVSYEVAATIKADFYIDDQFVESSEAPFSATVPPSSSITTYKRIGTDSLYFEKGSFSQFEGTPDGAQSEPGGLKYRIEGTTLYLTSVAKEFVDDYSTGVHEITSSTATVVTKLEKQ